MINTTVALKSNLDLEVSSSDEWLGKEIIRPLQACMCPLAPSLDLGKDFLLNSTDVLEMHPINQELRHNLIKIK